ncbi:phage holin, LLH family [Limosilactobacillus oris]|uniref:phage holin, LLH family n=1 Tax=Limosilactobacillus oris TaxID=1632 RepID=UPI0024B3B415|nr:phage holin, LLH family [Limosilactobacillus oris]WHO86479.1 phage holin, LLH family [Limosilactobacillus oris]
MMKTINDIVNWLISSGALSALFIFAWKYLKPVMIEKQKHAKTVREREEIGLLNQLADNAVNSLVNANAPGHEKFKQATALVDGALNDKGLNVQHDTITTAVQAAYEKSNLTPTVNPDEKPQTGVVVHD